MLEIPEWVPTAVASVAREMHAGLKLGAPPVDDYRKAIERLACDPRMRKVWQELRKTNRSGPERGSYYYPASTKAVLSHPLSSEIPAEGPVQDQACVLLFVELARQRSWGTGGIGPRAKTKKEAAGRIKKLRAAVERIRTEAGRLRDLGVGYLSPALEEVAGQCLALAKLEETFNSQDVLIVDRKTGQNEWERGFILTAAHLLEHLFGQKMHGVVAVLANVAFDKTNITEAQVGGMLRRGGVN